MKKLISLLLLLPDFYTAFSQKAGKITLQEKISKAAAAIETRCVEWRRQIHEYPELGNREFKTAKLIADHLKSLGIDVQEGVAKTGVVGILRGGKPGPVVALRTDMDALPVTNFHMHSGNQVEKIFWGRLPVTHASSLCYFNSGSIIQSLLH